VIRGALVRSWASVVNFTTVSGCVFGGFANRLVTEDGICLIRRKRCQVKPLRKKRLVFVSHSSADTWVAKQIAREIRRCGATPFLDEADIDVGSEFEDDILAFLNQAEELVVLLTPWALDRPYVWAELGAAWGRGIPMVVLLHGLTAGEFQSRPGIPIFLKKRDLISLNDVETYLAQLRQRMKSTRRSNLKK
jgi:TIR domain